MKHLTSYQRDSLCLLLLHAERHIKHAAKVLGKNDSRKDASLLRKIASKVRRRVKRLQHDVY